MSLDQFLREERLTYSISQAELERRWNAVRERMASSGIDYLITQSQQRFSSGYLRWFADISPSGYHTTLLFPQEGEMAIVAHGPRSPAPPAFPPRWMQRGVGTVINVPSTPSVEWEDDWHAKKAAAVIEGTKKRSEVTVGFVGLGNMSGALTEYIRKELPSAKFVNASSLVDDVKVIKSEEEQRLLKISAQLHARSYSLAKQAVRPGRRAIDVIQEIRTDQLSNGGEDGQVFIWFGPLGGPKYEQMSHGNGFIRRPFKDDDVVDILIECTGPGGYWYDLRRILYIGGSPPPELVKAHAISREALALLVSKCAPGAPAAAGMEAVNSYFREKNMPEELRILGHGQGTDMVETPMIDTEEPRLVEPGMCLALHPTAIVGGAAVSISDDYLITSNGAAPIHSRLASDDEIAIAG
ncbi:MAG TPA: M24 family metallopeptidase [Nitrososphaerales archaeon]|nr:M24 family metallopeptidase [Nitrososphaerales archaeon]